MVYSGMLRCVALVRTDVSEEHGTSFIRVTRIGELGTTLAVTSNRRCEEITRFGTGASVLTRATRRNIPEDAILQDGQIQYYDTYRPSWPVMGIALLTFTVYPQM
jgi:hypothetical protein